MSLYILFYLNVAFTNLLLKQVRFQLKLHKLTTIILLTKMFLIVNHCKNTSIRLLIIKKKVYLAPLEK